MEDQKKEEQITLTLEEFKAKALKQLAPFPQEEHWGECYIKGEQFKSHPMNGTNEVKVYSILSTCCSHLVEDNAPTIIYLDGRTRLFSSSAMGICISDFSYLRGEYLQIILLSPVYSNHFFIKGDVKQNCQEMEKWYLEARKAHLKGESYS